MAAYDRMSTTVGAAGIVAILAGLVLYWEVSGHLDSAWLQSPYGTSITVGAVAGLLSLVTGGGIVGLTNGKAVDLYEEVGDDELTDEQKATVETYYRRVQLGEHATAVLLLVAVLGMAVAQYV